MLLVAVVVKMPSGMIQKGAPILLAANPPIPTPEVKPVMAAVPVIWNSGPLGVTCPAAEATAVVTPAEGSVLKNPGTQDSETVEQSHCFPFL